MICFCMRCRWEKCDCWCHIYDEWHKYYYKPPRGSLHIEFAKGAERRRIARAMNEISNAI